MPKHVQKQEINILFTFFVRIYQKTGKQII